jgi:hypothetical protein
MLRMLGIRMHPAVSALLGAGILAVGAFEGWLPAMIIGSVVLTGSGIRALQGREGRRR